MLKTKLHIETRKLEFIVKAMDFFNEHSSACVYCDALIGSGTLLAIREELNSECSFDDIVLIIVNESTLYENAMKVPF